MNHFLMRWLIACVVSCMCATGCVVTRDAYTVVDTATGKRWGIKHRSRYPETIVSVQTNSFRVMTLMDERSKVFEIWDISYDGTILRRIKGAGLNDDVAEWYDHDMHESVAVSPSGSRVAYIDFATGALKYIDVARGGVETLCGGMPTNKPEARFIGWRSEEELVVGVEREREKTDQILVIDVTSGKTVLELNPVRLSLAQRYPLSWSGRYIAYVEKDAKLRGKLIVYDLESQRKVSDILPEHYLVSYVRWDPTDTRFLYQDGPSIMEYNVDTGEVKCVKRYPESFSKFIYGYNGQVAYLRACEGRVRADNDEGWKIRRLSVIDGTEEVLPGVEIRGSVRVSPDGRYIIVGWGY